MNGENLYKNLPETSGVYLMKDGDGRLLYIGKAGNLRRRVASYFLRANDTRIEMLVSRIRKIDHEKTDSALEALILEAKLIREYNPPFNVKEKDDKSFLCVEITKEKFPRVLLARGRNPESGNRFGPFTSASSTREALKILRRIFPWSTHANASNAKPQISSESTNKNSRHSNVSVDSHRDSHRRPCFDYEVGLCPGTCIGAISRDDYIKNIKRLKLFFEGKKGKVLRSLENEMKMASKNLEFEKAEKLRRQIFALQHIHDVALIGDSDDRLQNMSSQILPRIEGYDISNISGTSAVGSMVVFDGGEPNKEEYRKFKIKTVKGANDVGMLREILQRRFLRHHSHHSPIRANWRMVGMNKVEKWPLPDLILIDGGKGQINAAKEALVKANLKIPIVGIAKGPKRKRNDFLGKIPEGISEKNLIHVRDEAHRFAIGYHKQVRARNLLNR
jgi:excinuclease ABC subunit C